MPENTSIQDTLYSAVSTLYNALPVGSKVPASLSYMLHGKYPTLSSQTPITLSMRMGYIFHIIDNGDYSVHDIDAVKNAINNVRTKLNETFNAANKPEINDAYDKLFEIGKDWAKKMSDFGETAFDSTTSFARISTRDPGTITLSNSNPLHGNTLYYSFGPAAEELFHTINVHLDSRKGRLNASDQILEDSMDDIRALITKRDSVINALSLHYIGEEDNLLCNAQPEAAHNLYTQMMLTAHQSLANTIKNNNLPDAEGLTQKGRNHLKQTNASRDYTAYLVNEDTPNVMTLLRAAIAQTGVLSNPSATKLHDRSAERGAQDRIVADASKNIEMNRMLFEILHKKMCTYREKEKKRTLHADVSPESAIATIDSSYLSPIITESRQSSL